jgi:two-component system C4-dicarboxylate transport sensor histidine kinase DctB
MSDTAPASEIPRRRMPFWFRGVLAFLVILALGILFFSNSYFTARFTETQRIESQLASALYAVNVKSELQRHSLVAPALARDPGFVGALQSNDYARSSQRLIEFAAEIDVLSIALVDLSGNTVASSDRRTLGANVGDQPYVVSALRESGTVFTVTGQDQGTGVLGFHYSRRVQAGNRSVGAVVVTVNLRQIEESWRRRGETILITDSEDNIILSSNPFWRHNTLTNLLAAEPPPSGVARALRPAASPANDDPLVYLDGRAYLRSEAKIGFRGWRLTYFATLDDVRARVSGVLAFQVMVLAILVAVAFYLLSRRVRYQNALIARESSQLRALNARLQEEIAERQRVETNLRTAEQSLEQASKLAALGQMSAAVSHELNQPLAAMRTYLAGARLLLQRHRPDEALASFNRVDDLVERMGAITRQLKSYARKGGDQLVPLDVRDCVNSSLSMMAPQLGRVKVDLKKNMPDQPVMVMGDKVRLEQVIVNILRNALDATADDDDPMIDILLVQGRMVSLSIRDNGPGIENAEKLFEPFYTTKQPGEGVGLGLAISAGIAVELGGKLIARNASTGGAIFELRLPRAEAAAARAAE